MMRRVESLLITPTWPAESGNGLRMRASLLLKGLSRLGAVDLVVLPVHGREPSGRSLLSSAPRRSCIFDLDLTADARADFLARLANPTLRHRAAALHPRPTLCRAATVDQAEAIARLVGAAELVVVMRLYLAPFLDVVLDGEKRPVCVIDVDDVESTTRRRLGDAEEGDHFDRLERHYLPEFDLVLACSPEDAEDLANRCHATAAVVPNAVPIPQPVPDNDVRWDLLFVGNFSYAPNVEAAKWLCHEVLPRLPDARLALVGASPSAAIRDLARPGRIVVAADVPDLRPFYAASRVAVVPLLAGGGTSIKLLEALAHRRPVVSTSVGARGLPVRDGEHLLLADDPAAFAAACRRLLADPALAPRLAAAGHELVTRRFTTDKVAARLADLVQERVA